MDPVVRPPGRLQAASPGRRAGVGLSSTRSLARTDHSDGRHIQLVFLESDRYWAASATSSTAPTCATIPASPITTARDANRDGCVAALDEEFASRTYDEWKELLSGLDAPWAPVQSVEELLDDPQVLANGYLGDVVIEGGPSYRLPTVPVQFDERPPALRPAPEHGEHTEAILWSSDTTGTTSSGSRRPPSSRDQPTPGPCPRRALGAVLVSRSRHELVLARCSRCGQLTHPPDVVCPLCQHPDPGFSFEPVSGGGTIRSWIVLRQSFLPGLRGLLPLVLVDVALDEQADIRLIGRLLDGPDAPLGPRRPCAGGVRGDRPRAARVPAFTLEHA